LVNFKLFLCLTIGGLQWIVHWMVVRLG
jgi:hypothetical protein